MKNWGVTPNCILDISSNTKIICNIVVYMEIEERDTYLTENSCVLSCFLTNLLHFFQNLFVSELTYLLYLRVT